MSLRLSTPTVLFAMAGLGCGGSDEALFGALDADQHPMGSLQARVQFGTEGPAPFVADEAQALVSPGDQGDELVVHAADREARRSLALVISLSRAEIPGTVDLSEHLVVYTEVDASGRPQLLLDDVPSGTVDLVGDLGPGGEVAGTFQFALPESDSAGAPVVGLFEGVFSAPMMPSRR